MHECFTSDLHLAFSVADPWITGLLHHPIFVGSRGLRAEKYGHNSLIPRLIANLRKMFSHAKLRHATLFLSIFKKPKELS